MTDAAFNDQQWRQNDNGERYETTFPVSRYRALTTTLPVIYPRIELLPRLLSLTRQTL